MLEAIIKRLKWDKRGISNVIVVVLSLVLVVIIVANVVLWSYQMNQFDLERMQENIALTNVRRVTRSSWFTSGKEYAVTTGNRVSGTYGDTWSVNDIYETFEEVSAPTPVHYNPTGYGLVGSTTNVSGALSDLQNNDGVYMTFRSYPSQNSSGSFGYTTAGSTYTSVSVNYMYGSVFTSPANQTIAKSITFYGRGGSVTQNVKCLIVLHSTLTIVAITNSVPISTTAQWWTATFAAQPTLSASTDYVLMIIPAGTVRFYYGSGLTNQGHLDTTNSYSSPADPTEATHNNFQYSIYCNYNQPTQYTVGVEFTGTSNTQSWTQLTWTFDSSFSTARVNTTLQVWNYQTGQYSTSSNGYMSYTSSATPNTDETKTQTVITNPTDFRNSTGRWKMRMSGVMQTSTQFNLKIDWVEFKVMTLSSYRLDINGVFTLDTTMYPLANINSVEVQLRYRATDSAEKWFLKAYNWTKGQYSDVGFNSTVGDSPTTQFRYYTVNMANLWRSYVYNNGTVGIEFCDSTPDSNKTAIDIDFLGVRAVINGVKFSVQNGGPLTSHIVALWIVNSTIDRRYDANFFLNSGVNTDYIRLDVPVPVGNFTARIVTDRGNIAVSSS